MKDSNHHRPKVGTELLKQYEKLLLTTVKIVDEALIASSKKVLDSKTSPWLLLHMTNPDSEPVLDSRSGHRRMF